MSMKRALLAVVLMIFSSSLLFAKETKSVGVIFDKTMYDFGSVVCENKTHSCAFAVENQTDKPLVILSVNTSCSCLKATYSRRPMKIGQKSEITITLDAAKMEEGVFRRVIELQTNAGVFHVMVKGTAKIREGF